MSFGNHPSNIVKTTRKTFVELVHDMTGRDFLNFYRSFQNYFQKFKTIFQKSYDLLIQYLPRHHLGWSVRVEVPILWNGQEIERSKSRIEGGQHGVISFKLIIFLWMQGSIYKIRVSFKHSQAKWEPQQSINTQERYFRVALKIGLMPIY